MRGFVLLRVVCLTVTVRQRTAMKDVFLCFFWALLLQYELDVFIVLWKIQKSEEKDKSTDTQNTTHLNSSERKYVKGVLVIFYKYEVKY